MKKNILKEILNYIKEEYKFLILCLIIIFVALYKLPYNIYTGGGIININDRVIVSDGYKSDGSFNMAYVKEIRATIPTYLLSYIFSWDIVPISDELIDENDTLDDSWTRNRIYLEDSNDSALISAFKLANEKIDVIDSNIVVLYLLPSSKTNLLVGDIILTINDIKVSSEEELRSVLDNYQEGDRVNIKVKRNNKIIDCYSELINLDNKAKIGIMMTTKHDYVVDRGVEFKFKRNEAGPSAGFMMALEIYNQLTSDDLTHGLKIAGTGTIDIFGNIGSVGGIKYKLKGAYKNKAKIFLVSSFDYDEAIKEKNKNNYDIEVVKVNTLEEAVNYLRGVNI